MHRRFSVGVRARNFSLKGWGWAGRGRRHHARARRGAGRRRAPHTYAKTTMHAVATSMSARADFAKKRAAARGWA